MPDANHAARRDELTNKKKQLLLQRIRAKNQSSSSLGTTIPRNQMRHPHASAGQRQIWLFQQLNPVSTAYNMFDCYQVEGCLDPQGLQSSLDMVIARHESLRTGFAMENGELCQVIEDTVDHDIHVIDLTDVELVMVNDAAELPDKVRHHLDKSANICFDLATPPLLNLTLIQTAQHSIIALTLHHTVSDEQSNRIVWSELVDHYRHHITGTTPEMSSVVQYADFTEWQRQRIAQNMLDEQHDYWQRRLVGAPMPALLPGDRPRPTLTTYNGGMTRRTLSAPLTEKVRHLTARHEASLFATLLAVNFVLLYRYTRQDDLIIGLPVTSRTVPALEQTVGYFLNTLPLWITVEPSIPFSTLLEQVRDQLFGILANREFPFELLADTVHGQHTAGQLPFFRTMFVLQDSPQTFDSGSASMHRLEYEQKVSKFDLTLFVRDDGDCVHLAAEYNSDIFNQPTIDRLLGHFETLVHSIVNQPDTALHNLELLTSDEREQLLSTWASTADPPTDLRPVHELIAAQAVATPDATALIYRDTYLSYRSLESRASALAHMLMAQGVTSGQRIGIGLERSPAFFIAMLAILKVGGTYVPLDPTYPVERLHFMLEDAGIAVVLTQPEVGITWPSSVRTLHVDNRQHDNESFRHEAPHTTVSLDDLAYIIYTSGSSGRPKGVAVSHRNLAASTLARHLYYPDKVGCYLLLSPVAFDSSIAGIYWTLTQGGALCLPEPGGEKDPTTIMKLIHEHQVSHTLCLPSLYDILLDMGQEDQLASLKTVVVAGEACPAHLPNKHRTHLPQARLYNEYGPTEGTVWSTVYEFTAEHPLVPIGRPIPGMKTYILDSNQQLVPIGVPGELYIGGVGLTAGYINRPELTEEKFVTLPLTGERMYRTGDLVRYLPDGNIIFLGRVDQQVKIRGHRIEIEEIENVLNRQTGVQQGVVIAVPAKSGTGDELVAFITSVAGERSMRDVQTLKQSLTRTLPDYMIPVRIHLLDALPLLPNGKIDRSAVIQLDAEQPEKAREFVNPRDKYEALLVPIWSEIMGIARISVEDNFFDIGGSSLQAARLISRINRTLKTHLNLEDLIFNPTMAALAEKLRTDQTVLDPQTLQVVMFHPDGQRPIIWGATDNNKTVFGYLDLAERLGTDQPLYMLRPPGLYGEAEPFEQIDALARHYVGLVKLHQPTGPYYLCGHSVIGLIVFEMAQQLIANGDEVALLALFDTAYYDDSTAAEITRLTRRKRFKRLKRILALPRYLIEYLQMPAAERKHWLKQKFERAAPMLSPEVMHQRAVSKATKRAAAHYTIKPYSGKIVFFSARQGRGDSDARLPMPREAAWESIAEGGFTLVDTSGDHRILGSPHAQLAADTIRRFMDRYQQETKS